METFSALSISGAETTASTNNIDSCCKISVSIRVRPICQIQDSSTVFSSSTSLKTIPWQLSSSSITQIFYDQETNSPCSLGPSFTFDRVFGPECFSNKVLFDQVARPIVEGCLRGINGTIFAYGQTSAGKTFTMQGDLDNPGIIPLSIEYIFDQIKHEDHCITVKASYMEIYNEVITDLISADHTNLKIHETLDRDIYVGDLTQTLVTCSHSALQVLQAGQVNRTVGKTNMNEHSSRSHTIYQMTIDREIGSEATGIIKRHSTMTFVDLAGSERVRISGTEGIRLKEGGHINRSLLSLTTVISKLAEIASLGGTSSMSTSHVPFRDSKLTRILQPCLGGNALTAIICAINPDSRYTEESLSTLKFASRAKMIENKPLINEIVSADVKLARLEQQLIKHKEEHKLLVNMIIWLQQTLVNMQRELTLVIEEESVLKGDCNQGIVDNLHGLVKLHEERLSRNQNDNIEFQSDASKVEAARSLLQEHLHFVDEHYHSALVELESALVNRQTDIDLLLTRSTNQQAEWRAQTEALQARLDELQGYIDQITDQCTKYKIRAETAEHDLSIDRSLITTLEQDLERVKQEHSNDLTRLEETKTKEEMNKASMIDLSSALDQLQTRLNQTEHDRQDLTRQLQTTLALNTEQAVQLTTTTSKYSVLEQEFHALKNEHVRVLEQQTVVEQESKKANGLQKELDMSKETMEALKNDLETLQGRLACARTDLDRKQAELEQAKAIHSRTEDELRHDLDRYEHDMQTLTRQLDRTQTQLTESEEALAKERETSAKVSSRTPDISTSSSELLFLKLEVDKLKRTLGKERKIHALQLSELQDQLQQQRVMKRGAEQKEEISQDKTLPSVIENAKATPEQKRFKIMHDEVKKENFIPNSQDMKLNQQQRTKHPPPTPLNNMSKLSTPEACKQQ